MVDDNIRIWERESKKEREEKKEVKIIVSKNQYAIKIPIDFAETIGIKEGDKFEFTLKIPPIDSKEEPELKGGVIHGRKK